MRPRATAPKTASAGPVIVPVRIDIRATAASTSQDVRYSLFIMISPFLATVSPLP
jgi:hypothetical protein